MRWFFCYFCDCYLRRENICRYLYKQIARLSHIYAVYNRQNEERLNVIEGKVRLYDKIRLFGMPATTDMCERNQVPFEARPPWE